MVRIKLGVYGNRAGWVRIELGVYGNRAGWLE